MLKPFVEALRNPKHPQCRGLHVGLLDGVVHCCALGEIILASGVARVARNQYSAWLVSEELGLYEAAGIPPLVANSIAAWNDAGLTFAQIADELETL